MLPDKGCGVDIPKPSGEDEPLLLRADARRNRVRVVEAASEAFASSGLAVPMEAIARQAGVGVGTLYRHFPTKEALFAAVVRHHLDLLVGEAHRLADADDAEAALSAFVARMAEETSSKRDMIECLSRAGVEFDDAASGVKEDLTAGLGALLERAQRAGAIRGDLEAAELMTLVAGACMASAHQGVSAASRARLVAVICDGLRTAAPGPIDAEG